MTACRMLLALAFAAALLPPADAQTLRWAARGDSQSMDPHAFAEAVTNNLNALVYDALVERDAQQNIVPALADRWNQPEPTRWRFRLRAGVRFQDGSPLTVDDVLFSIIRAQQASSQFNPYAVPLGVPVKIDEETLELRQTQVDPVLLQHLAGVLVMSRAWTLAHQAERVPDFKSKQEAATSRSAMGTGRFLLEERQPGVRTTFTRNPAWWGRFEGNVQKIVFTPIASDATRTAALLAGDIDLTQDVPPQDRERFESGNGARLVSDVENRLIFLAFDQWRDRLLYASVPGRNPFKDVRVREAFFRAINVQALASSIMRGQALPTGCLATAAIGCFAKELETHPPVDVDRARRLMAAAGYADGFELTLDCPNDRYVNDRALCLALVGMLSRIGVTLKVDARPKTQFFPKVQSGDSSFWLQGWGGTATDPQILMDTFLHSPDAALQKGNDNLGHVSDAELDRWIDAAGAEADPVARGRLLRTVQIRVSERYYYLPLHRQIVVWGARAQVHPVVTANNMVRADWIRID